MTIGASDEDEEEDDEWESVEVNGDVVVRPFPLNFADMLCPEADRYT